ncbi:PDDEXK nuclease domain-containing protein [Parapedobacter tibetensis]|uniref:PDDEXK nuclease domain-containing protein n=1 Tax=Parapedobacter tibetensis TaxID=2972951 RepID=UPI00214D782C|nr:PDDEXK nuclease domain-containing protein [Parapedobacter tibetensis]
MEITVEYKTWIAEVKTKVRSSQIKAALAVNSELIGFYWELGRMITEMQARFQWGDKVIDRASNDLKEEFPDMNGLSPRNLKYCRQFYQFYHTSIGQQVVAQLSNNLLDKTPWGHNILIFSKSKDVEEARFYLQQTIENNWSRDTLALQLKSNLYERNGKAITNFKYTLPEPVSDLAQQTLKDPYVFDFITMAKSYKERDIENQLIQHITKFLLELGKGFAFIGRQYHLVVGENDYYLDLLFYHTRLKCYTVVEIKNTAFIPEYAGKLNFYLSAVDSLVKLPDDNPTIGILLCRDKNNIEAEFALRDINKPMGVSEFQLAEVLPDNLKSSLPSVEELEEQLKKMDEEE